MSAMNGNARSKRKLHTSVSHDIEEPPLKQHKPANGTQSTGDNTPEPQLQEFAMEDAFEDVGRVAALLPVAPTDTAEWQRAIENVVRSVVSIRFCQTCSFDTDPALTSEATGFIVDAERGFVLRDDQFGSEALTFW